MSENPRVTSILAVGTAVPTHSANQKEAVRFFSRVLGEAPPSRRRDRALDLAEKLATTSGVHRRHSVISDFGAGRAEDFRFFPPRWDLEPFPTTGDRMRLYEETCVELAAGASTLALRRAEVRPDEVTHLVVCTCTGFFSPGPDILLAERLGLRPDISRTIIGFMGCHGGFNGLRAADQIIGSQIGAVVLQVCVELCTIHYQKRPELDAVVVNSLFADGCAAVVYGAASRGGQATVAALHSRVEADSLGHMTWRIGETGFEMGLDVRVPERIAAAAPRFLDELIKRAGGRRRDLRRWAIHPGGPRVIESVGASLALSGAEMQPSLGVLRDFGNMSSGTVFFIIERVLEEEPLPVPMVALGFGPGLTIEGVVLEPPGNGHP